MSFFHDQVSMCFQRSDSSSVTYETRSTAPPLPPIPHRDSAHRESATGSYSPVQGLSRTIEIPKDTLLEDMVALLNSGRFSDVTLDVGKREFNVHKAILAARSAVFDTMFSFTRPKTSKRKIPVLRCGST